MIISERLERFYIGYHFHAPQFFRYRQQWQAGFLSNPVSSNDLLDTPSRGSTNIQRRGFRCRDARRHHRFYCIGGVDLRHDSACRDSRYRCQQLATVHRERQLGLNWFCHAILLVVHQGGQAIRWFVVSDHIPMTGTTLLRISRLVRADALVLMRGEFGRVGERNQPRGRPAMEAAP